MFDFIWSKKKSEKSTILIVDDEPKIVQTLQDRLEMNDYNVLIAFNGKEGMEQAAKQKPDVVLLDILMPVMNGHEMLAALRKEPGLEDTPVIMLTARSQQQDIQQARALGIEDYIVKPFEVSELLAKIENIVESRKAAVK